jgi:hypothetical protein
VVLQESLHLTVGQIKDSDWLLDNVDRGDCLIDAAQE